jgi:type II secretory pathway pseudopilin PulG
MKGGTAGFTMVETMIALAVSMALFVSAVALINGKQNVTAFNQAIRAIETQMQQVISDVGSGFYENDGSISCTESGGAVRLTKSAVGSTEQGTNEDCLFVGKVVQFSVGTADPEKYNVYTVAGLRGSSSNPLDTLTSSKARLVAYGNGDNVSTMPDVFQSRILQYGLTVSSKTYAGSSMAVGFTSSLGSLGTEDNSQRVNMLNIAGVNRTESKEAGVQIINSNLKTATVNNSNGFQICFNSGGTNQSGLMTLGGSDRQGSVDMKIFDKLDCNT